MTGTFSNLFSQVRKHQFGYSVLILFLTYLFTRLPFFLWAKLPGLNPDTLSYNEPVYQLLVLHKLPNFDILPPGYSLFLTAMNLMGLSNLGIIYVHTILHFASFVFLLYAFNRYYPKKLWYVLIAILATVITAYDLTYDTYVISESIYTSTLICCMAATIVALNGNSLWRWVLVSVFMSIAYCIRPTGLIVFPIAALLVLYFIIKKIPLRNAAALFSILVLTFVVRYGYTKSQNHKSVIPGDGEGVALFTAPIYYMARPDASLPDTTNAIITKYNSMFDPQDLQVVDQSWSLPLLWQTYTHLRQVKPGKDTLTHDERKFFKKVVFKEKAGLKTSGYFKYYLSMVYGYHIDVAVTSPQFYFSIIPVRYEQYYKESYLKYIKGDIQKLRPSDEFKRYAFKEYYQDSLSYFNTDLFDFYKSNNLYLKAYHLVYKLHGYIFKNILWVIAYIILLACVALKPFKDPYRFLLVIIGLFSFLTSVIVCLSQYAHSRYTYPTLFSFYLFVILGTEYFISSQRKSKE